VGRSPDKSAIFGAWEGGGGQPAGLTIKLPCCHWVGVERDGMVGRAQYCKKFDDLIFL
jgi:hypothetical protein